MTSDVAREIHGGVMLADLDKPSNEECLANAQHILKALESGDENYVPPWMTMEEAIGWSRGDVARCEARIAAPKCHCGIKLVPANGCKGYIRVCFCDEP